MNSARKSRNVVPSTHKLVKCLKAFKQRIHTFLHLFCKCKFTKKPTLIQCVPKVLASVL